MDKNDTTAKEIAKTQKIATTNFVNAKSKPKGEVKIMRNKGMLIVINVLIVLASFSVVARAQDAPYRLSDKEVKKLMAQLKKDTGKFRKSLDSSLDRSRLNGTNREDDINAIVKNYEDATERLYSRFKDNKSVGADVEAVLDGAAELDRFMTRRLAGEKAERDPGRRRGPLARGPGRGGPAPDFRQRDVSPVPEGCSERGEPPPRGAGADPAPARPPLR